MGKIIKSDPKCHQSLKWFLQSYLKGDSKRTILELISEKPGFLSSLVSNEHIHTFLKDK